MYVGAARIRRQGETYLVEWKTLAGEVYTGIGLRDGAILGKRSGN